MGKIKLKSGEVIDDRRGNGARLRLDTGDWIKIYSSMGSLLIAGIWFSANITFTVKQHCVDILKLQSDVEKTIKNTNDNTMDIQSLKGTLSKVDSNVEKLLDIQLKK
jgi:hypothetical protein